MGVLEKRRDYSSCEALKGKKGRRAFTLLKPVRSRAEEELDAELNQRPATGLG